MSLQVETGQNVKNEITKSRKSQKVIFQDTSARKFHRHFLMGGKAIKGHIAFHCVTYSYSFAQIWLP